MQVENDTPTPPRSKLEYLYRDLLIECHQLTQRQEVLIKQIDEAAIRMGTFNAQLRQSTQQAAQQAGARIQHTVENASNSLNAATQRLLATENRLVHAGQQQLRTVALVATAAGALGGLLGVLVTTLLLT